MILVVNFRTETEFLETMSSGPPNMRSDLSKTGTHMGTNH